MKFKSFAAAVFLMAVLTSLFCNDAIAGEGKHLFMLSGQSNMRKPLPEAFTESVSKVFGEDNVIVVTLAQPSQPIRRWYKEWTPPAHEQSNQKGNCGDLYEQLVKKVKVAVKDAQLASVTYIWMQGEADAGNGWGSVYEKSFYGVLDQFKNDLSIKEINFVVGRINDFWLTENGTKDGDLVRSILKKLGEENENGDWVNTDDLNRGVNPWGGYELEGGHFPTPAYRVLGQRFARKACKLIDPDIKLNEKHFDAVFVDSTDQIAGHSAVGKTISGTKPGERKDADLGLLLDGKFASQDTSDKGWLIFSSEQKDAQLLIDLGDTRAITAVGINMLINDKVGAHFPKSAVISISEDGKEYRHVRGGRKPAIWFFYKEEQRQKVHAALEPQPLLALFEFGEKNARFIKIEIAKDDSSLFIDEVIVDPEPRAGDSTQ